MSDLVNERIERFHMSYIPPGTGAYPPPPNMPGPPTPAKKSKAPAIVGGTLAAALLMFVSCGVGAMAGGSGENSTAASTITATETRLETTTVTASAVTATTPPSTATVTVTETTTRTTTQQDVGNGAVDNTPRGLIPNPPATEDSGGSSYYSNCSAARAAGAAPVHAGDPGYGPHLDRDGDGVGCE